MSENVKAYAPYDSEGNRMPLACPVEYLYDKNGYGAGERWYLPQFYDVAEMSPVAGVTGFFARYANGLVLFRIMSTATASATVKNGAILLTNLPAVLRPASTLTIGFSTCTGASGLMRSAANILTDGHINETHSVNEDRNSASIYTGALWMPEVASNA